MNVQTLVFSDTDEFYERLKAALKTGDEVEVVTEYERFSDLPERLKTIFELENARAGTWVAVATGAFVPGARIASALNTKALIVLGATATGAGLGALAGGPVGAGIGAGVGLAAGTVASVFLDRDHEVEVEIDKRGKLKVKVRPAKK